MSAYESTRVGRIKISPAITVSMAARAMRAAGETVIDLSLGEPDFETPENVIEAAYAAMKRGETRYTPPDGTPALKEAIVEKFRRDNGLVVDSTNVSCANGAKQVIFNALLATLEPGDEVICPAPYWASYTDMVLLLDGVPIVVKCTQEDGFKLTPEALETAITSRSRWLILNSPSNPSGAVYSKAEFRALGSVIERHPRLLVISDEIYEHIHFAEEPFASFRTACPELADQTVIVNGVAKAYAMTGWRIGYAVAPSDLAKVMGKIQSQSTSNPCSISQAAAVEALTGTQDFVTVACAEYLARRDLVMQGLATIPGVETTQPDGAFYVYPSVKAFIGRTTPCGETIQTDTDLASYLLQYGKVATVQGAAFGLSPNFRISFALSRTDLNTAVERIRDAFAVLE